LNNAAAIAFFLSRPAAKKTASAQKSAFAVSPSAGFRESQTAGRSAALPAAEPLSAAVPEPAALALPLMAAAGMSFGQWSNAVARSKLVRAYILIQTIRNNSGLLKTTFVTNSRRSAE
jgi:hypothetical protein